MGVVALAQLAYIIRFLWYAFINKAIYVLPVEVLHGEWVVVVVVVVGHDEIAFVHGSINMTTVW